MTSNLSVVFTSITARFAPKPKPLCYVTKTTKCARRKCLRYLVGILKGDFLFCYLLNIWWYPSSINFEEKYAREVFVLILKS